MSQPTIELPAGAADALIGQLGVWAEEGNRLVAQREGVHEMHRLAGRINMLRDCLKTDDGVIRYGLAEAEAEMGRIEELLRKMRVCVRTGSWPFGDDGVGV